MKDTKDSLLLENQVCFPTYAVFNKILRRYQPLLKELDLTYTQYIIMMVMWEKEVVNEKEIGEALYLKPNTLTDTLRLMEKKGLIEKKKNEKDKRHLIISITEKGRKLKNKAVNVPKTLYEEHWLTDEEFETYRRLLYKLLDGDWAN
ncbi:MAG: MarR family transcriptional regulator [Acholeplasmatales bacterium]|nr:MarR family transcriptional regulator [Acholeplasmatales bacterium]